jgi:DNA-binding response OmpR family regulator
MTSLAGPMPRSTTTPWVLVIEDIRDQAELCTDVCAQAGFNATTAANGLLGYNKARTTRPDLIVLDLILPDVDGWEVCKQLKADPQTKDIPIVILTAHEEAHGALIAREAGCAAYLKKPCPPTELVRVLNRVLRDQHAGKPAGVSRTPQLFEAIDRLKAIFIEVPGTQLSVKEASRMSGLDPERCQPVLDALVSTGFLTRGRDGRFRKTSQ